MLGLWEAMLAAGDGAIRGRVAVGGAVGMKGLRRDWIFGWGVWLAVWGVSRGHRMVLVLLRPWGGQLTVCVGTRG